jgi:hypothetical protein
MLGVSEPDFRRLIEDREHTIDAGLLIDVLAALVREFGVDPQWLLVGEYNGASHRRALTLFEEQGRAADQIVRDFLREQIRRLRAGLPPWSLLAQ